MATIYKRLKNYVNTPVGEIDTLLDKLDKLDLAP